MIFKDFKKFCLLYFFLLGLNLECLSTYFMQKHENQKLRKVDNKKLDILDRFLRILWRKEVEYKINI